MRERPIPKGSLTRSVIEGRNSGLRLPFIVVFHFALVARPCRLDRKRRRTNLVAAEGCSKPQRALAEDQPAAFQRPRIGHARCALLVPESSYVELKFQRPRIGHAGCALEHAERVIVAPPLFQRPRIGQAGCAEAAREFARAQGKEGFQRPRIGQAGCAGGGSRKNVSGCEFQRPRIGHARCATTNGDCCGNKQVMVSTTSNRSHSLRPWVFVCYGLVKT